MRRISTAIEPVCKVRVLPVGLDAAFAGFTDRMGSWWPLGMHSIAGDDAVGVRVEGRVGGRIVEIARDGTEYEWADVIAWDPPHRMVVAWHPSPDPVAATIWEVRFSTTDEGSELYLEHREWEELGVDALLARRGYDEGWDPNLDRFVDSLG